MHILFIILVWLPLLFEIIFKTNLNLILIILIELFLFATTIIGTAWNVYSIFTPLDKIIHICSGILFGLLFYDIYTKLSKTQLSPFWLCLFIFSFAMMIGGVWEIIEFSLDGIIPGQNTQKWQGFVGRDALNDTMFDLICDFIGAIIIAVYVFFYKRRTYKQKQTQIKE